MQDNFYNYNDDEHKTEYEPAEIIEEPSYTWNNDDYQCKTVYGTARPLYKEKKIKKNKKNLWVYGGNYCGNVCGAIIFAGAGYVTNSKLGNRCRLRSSGPSVGRLLWPCSAIKCQ